MSQAVIIAASRTPIGAFLGELSSLTAPQLGSIAIKDALAKANVAPEKVGWVCMGNVLQAGEGQAPARQAALGAGIPNTVPALTINKVCGSGLQAVILAAQQVLTGEYEIAVAGGMESMSNAPYLLPKARGGYRMGPGVMVDSMIADGLWDPYDDVHMGNCGELCAEKYAFTREQQDEFAKASGLRSQEAARSGAFKDEIAVIEVPQRKGDPIRITDDEGPKKINVDKIGSLKAAFKKEGGTITAANASSINDGATAVIVTTEAHAKKIGAPILARITGWTGAAVEPKWFTIAPVDAIKKLMTKTGKKVEDVDLWEINEAFAVVTMAPMKEFNLDHAKVNVNGGAVALGHPIGSSGARILTTLVHAMKNRGKKTGVAAICIGGGEALAMMVERP